jgi:hypothetical protein
MTPSFTRLRTAPVEDGSIDNHTRGLRFLLTQFSRPIVGSSHILWSNTTTEWDSSVAPAFYSRRAASAIFIHFGGTKANT